MNQDRGRLGTEVLVACQTVFRALQAAVAPEWLQLDLSMAQLKALFAVSRGAPLSVSGLAEALAIGLPYASHLVEQLVQQGLAARQEDPQDRRRALVSLTPDGRRLVARLHQGGRERLRAWVAQLDTADLATLAQGLRALARVIEADHRALPPQG